MPSFLASIADKAQSAINATPLAGHIPPLHGRPSSPSPSAELSGQPQAATQSGYRSHAFDAIQHQLRTIGQQYATTSPLQKIITIEKGVAIDVESLSRDSKAQSKELYSWGQSQDKDLEDVTDRLAYLNFVQGALAGNLATKLETARAPLKSLRDLEASLTPRRNIRAGLKLQISRLEHDQQRGSELRMAELRQQLKKAESEDEQAEKEAELLTRKAIRESEQAKWDAFREYGEKLVLVSQAGNPIVAALPTLPPTPAQPYAGAQVTAAARAALQQALDNYKLGQTSLIIQTGSSELSKSDTASFGESHASELSSISSDHITQSSTILTPPPAANAPLPSVAHDVAHTPTQPIQPKVTDPIDPLTLNQTPTVLPSTGPITLPATTSEPAPPIPTIADTGVPVSAGSGGPGPATGSLLDLRAQRAATQSQSAVGLPAVAALASSPAPESAEDEKKRLAREERERALAAEPPVAIPADGSGPSSITAAATAPSTTSAPAFESADDEKKRLEREERERILRRNAQQEDQADAQEDASKDEDLPPYQPI